MPQAGHPRQPPSSAGQRNATPDLVSAESRLLDLSEGLHCNHRKNIVLRLVALFPRKTQYARMIIGALFDGYLNTLAHTSESEAVGDDLAVLFVEIEFGGIGSFMHG